MPYQGFFKSVSGSAPVENLGFPPPSQKLLVPVIKLGVEETYAPWEHIQTDAVVVRMQDILQDNGKHFNSRLEKIRERGGIHKFLGYEGKTILSTIMKDKTLFGCEVEKYVETMRVLKPDYFMSLDCETYEGEKYLAELEIERALRETKEIIGKCKGSIPLGLVKGSNMEQVEGNTDSLLSLGAKSMVFHSGDFLCRGNDLMISRAKQYAKRIHEKSGHLFLYGLGCENHFRRFLFGDVFITQSHYVNSFYRQKYLNGKWVSHGKAADRKGIMTSLCGLDMSLYNLEDQGRNGGLRPWVEELGATGHHTQRLDRAAPRHLPETMPLL